MTISEQVVKAMPDRIYAVKRTEGSNCVVSFDTPSLDYNVEYIRAALTAALPFLSVQGAVKKLEWTKGVVDIASPHPGMKYVACNTTPKGSWAWWLDHAPETRAVFTSEEAAKAAAQADYEARILSALEPSAARELALEEAAQVAEMFPECDLLNVNGNEVSPAVNDAFKRGAFAQGKAIAAAIRTLSSPEHADDLAVDRFAIAMKQKLAKKREEGRGGWENKDECSAEYLSYLLIQHIWKGDPVDIANLAMMLHQRGERVVIDSETSFIIPDHADAGKVEGDGWLPTHRHKKRGTHYSLIGIGKMQADNWQVSREGFDQSIDMEEVSIYRSVDDGSLWVRPREEFEDGRFETLPTHPSGGDRHGE